MQKLAEICIRRPIFASMLILALVVVGSAAYVKLGVDRLPSVDLPVVSIRTNLPGATPEQVESEVTELIEEAVNTIEGIEELRSISGPGNSVVIVTFKLEREIDVATQDVRDRIATVLRRLPEGIDPPTIAKSDNDNAPVMTVALYGPRSVRELTELADKVVKVQLERTSGVGEVSIWGGLDRTVNIWVKADRLAAYQLPITAVRDAIRRQNADVPGGNVTAAAREQVLRMRGQIDDPRQFNDVVVATVHGAPVRLSDVARVEDGAREKRSVARLNGEPTVVLEVRRQAGANTVKVIEDAKANMALVMSQLPRDVKMEVIRDQSTYIYAALHEINLHLLVGSGLACMVVLVFMRNWRSTIIAGIAIPTSVVATFGVMWALDFTLNSVTMLALVLMVGIVIDDAIVVLENIYRFIEEKRMSPMRAAAAATAEIGLAVMATTFSLVVIFIPVSFMSSISGRFLYQFGITAAVAVMVSLLVSFTLTPMMSARLLRAGGGHGGDSEPASRRGFYRFIDAGYSAMLGLAMRHRAAVCVVALLVVASAVPLYRVVRQDYLPSDVDEGEFTVNITAPEGASMAAMDQTMRVIEQTVRDTPGVRLVLASGGGGFVGQINQGGMYVRIAPHEERIFSLGRLWRSTLSGEPLAAFRGNYSQRDVMLEVRKRLRRFADIRPSVRSFQAFNIGGGSWDINFVFRGPDLRLLSQYAESLRARSEELGIVDADTSLRLDKPELQVNVDRERASTLGVELSDIGDALRLMVGGDREISRFRDPHANEYYDVQLRLEEQDRNDPSLLPRLYLPRRDGGIAELANLASIQTTPTASRIDRTDRQRAVALRASVAPGFALADRIEVLRKASSDLNMPLGYSTLVAGRGKELERTFNEFIWAFALSVAFMYMILAAQYESLLHPLTILLSLPLAVPFALLSLWATGGTLNLYSALGILVLFGVVKKNAILQIDHMNKLRDAGLDRGTAIMQANRDRLRPILMTTLSLVAGMLPLAVGTGPGAEERRAVAIVVIGGQSLCLLLTLLVTPVAYSVFDDIGATIRRALGRGPGSSREEAGAVGALDATGER